MVIIRQLLLQIRKLHATLTEKQKGLLGVLFFVLLGVGVAIDTFLPFNYFLNVLRAAIALALALLIFGGGYIYLTYYKDRKKEESELADKITLRERFSYRQRLNLSIVSGGIIFVFALMFAKESPVFTVVSALLIVAILSTLSFLRSTRSETQGASLGINDARDVAFQIRRDEELRRREEEAAKKDVE